MFSISTVASSTRMPTASARPPSVIMLSVWPSAENTMTDTRIESGIETTMTSVERQEPRNSRIISPVSAGGDHRLAQDAVERRAHEHRLVEQRLDLRARAAGSPGCAAGRRARGCTMSSVDASARLQHGQQRRAPAVDVHHRGLDRRSRRAPGRRRAGRPSPAPSCFTGMSFSVSKTSGDELVRTLYSVGPIFAVPAGRMTFCALSAVETSIGDRPLA